jgi:hypothetical protein
LDLKSFAVLLLTRSSDVLRRKKRMWRKTVSSAERDPQWTDLLIVIGKKVRDHIAPVDDMLGQVVVRSQTRTKPIDEKRSPTERRITARPVLQIPYCLLAAEATDLTVTASAIVRGTVISIDPIAVAGTIPWATMIGRGGTERMSGKSSTEREVILEEASMSYLMAMKDPVEVGDEELTVMGKVLVARG